MRDRGLLVSGLVLVLLVPACGKQGESPAGKAAKAKAVTTPTEAPPAPPPPTATEEPTATPEPSPTPLPTSPPEPQDAAEDLQLLGIIRGGATSGALIAYNGKQEIFRKGDSVFDHGVVKDVREDSVIIRSGNKDTTLKISEAPAAPAEPPPAAEQVVESTPPAREAAPPPATEPLSRAELRGGLRDLADVLAKADAKRVSVGGGHGLQLGKVEAATFLAKLGLRNGDVLMKINGTPIDDLDKVPDLSSSADGNELTVTYARNDITLTVSRRVQ